MRTMYEKILWAVGRWMAKSPTRVSGWLARYCCSHQYGRVCGVIWVAYEAELQDP